MEYILRACNVSYEIQERPKVRTGRFPYRDCVDAVADIVWDGNRLLMGKNFWNADTLDAQRPVYLLKYILNVLFFYLPVDDNLIYETEASIMLIIESCLVPYQQFQGSVTEEHESSVPQGWLTFEEYMHATFR